MELEDYNLYFRIENQIEKDLWSKAIFVFDTSALLEIYYYSEGARKEIFEKTLSLLKTRLWITGHTNFEYLKNRQGVIFKAFSEKYNALKNEDIPGLSKSITTLSNQINNIKQLTQKKDVHLYINQEIYSRISTVVVDLKSEYEKLKTDFNGEVAAREIEIKKLEKDDEVYNYIIKSFQKTAELSYDEIKEVLDEGTLRYAHNIPPGYKDGIRKDKKDGVQKFGDLIIWKQIIKLCQTSEKPIIFITNDVKEDWCIAEKRSNEHRILSPHDDLIVEFRHKTQKQFWMYSFSQFLYKAKEILNSEITDESLEEVKSIGVEINKNRQLRFDCLYSSEEKITGKTAYKAYIRFFEDGTVVTVSSTDLTEELYSLLDHNFAFKGTYSIVDNNISFTINSSYGKVDYSGTIEDSYLLLNSISHINGRVATEKFYIVPKISG